MERSNSNQPKPQNTTKVPANKVFFHQRRKDESIDQYHNRVIDESGILK